MQHKNKGYTNSCTGSAGGQTKYATKGNATQTKGLH